MPADDFEPARRARELWPVFESYHAMIYFAPEAAEAFRALGLKGGWMGYFASRSAPMGPAPPGLVTAVFFNFHPAMVGPARRLGPGHPRRRARHPPRRGRRRPAPAPPRPRELGRHGRGGRTGPGGGRGAAGGRTAPLRRPAGAPLARGRPPRALARRHPAAGAPGRRPRGRPHRRGARRLRGPRDAGCHRPRPPETLQQNRWWSDKDWDEAEARLEQGGWLDAKGRLTEAGRAGRQRVEDTTDALAAEPWRRLGPERTGRLGELMAPMARAVVERGGMPVPNPIGVPAVT